MKFRGFTVKNCQVASAIIRKCNNLMLVTYSENVTLMLFYMALWLQTTHLRRSNCEIDSFDLTQLNVCFQLRATLVALDIQL